MGFNQRLTIYLIVMAGLVVAAGWQSLVIDRYGKRLKAFFGDKDYTTFKL